jgi:hypothetical protein
MGRHTQTSFDEIKIKHRLLWRKEKFTPKSVVFGKIQWPKKENINTARGALSQNILQN